jgi:leucyl aminopeptidase
MFPKIIQVSKINSRENLISLNPFKDLQSITSLENSEIEYLKNKIRENESARFNKASIHYFFLDLKKIKKENLYAKNEELRKKGFEIAQILKAEKIKSVQITGSSSEIFFFLEGLILSSYRFQKYKSKKEAVYPDTIEIFSDITKKELSEFENLIKGVFLARNLVNEPASYLTAETFSNEIKKSGKEAGFSVEVFNKKKIESLRMGGLLAVNKGSKQPPTFNILEYKPGSFKNKKPIVLVGKGVVYDTGGLSLKPSESMELMKCDMAGGAAVTGAIYAAAKNKLPLHIIGLIPATDNRPWEDAVSPGDVITISDGTTVEVLNTDAEGRLILADALTYAKKFNPELVIDLATLTGSAIRAIGREGIVMMAKTPEKIKKEFMKAGSEVHERLVEFPLWKEYGKQIESDIADIKNIGGQEAGAITAAKFLEHFVDYNWIHLDIAGPAFLTSADSYRGKNGTGVGVRLLYSFLKYLVLSTER